MRKTLTTIALFCGLTSVFSQNYTLSKDLKGYKEEFTISVNENEKNKIDWKIIEDFYHDKKENDSIKFSVKVIKPQKNNLKSENKYTVQGIAKNINALIDILKNKLK